MSTVKSGFTPLVELAMDSGIDVPCAGNQPVNLDDPDSIWFIDQGSVNLFLLELKDGIEQAAPQFLMSRESGWLLPGVSPYRDDDANGTTLHLIAKGSPVTSLKRLPASVLKQADPAEVGRQIDTWLSAMTDTLARFTKPLPRPTKLAKPGRIETGANCILSVRQSVVWVTKPAQSSFLLMDIVDQADVVRASGENEVLIPLTRTSWITLFDETTLTGVTTDTLAARGELMSALASFHAVALNLEQLNRRLAVVDVVNLERARTTSRRTAETKARQRLFNIYDLPVDRELAIENTEMADALQIIGQREKINFNFPVRSTPSAAPVTLNDVLNASGVRARRVQFKNEGKWWWGNSGSILAFRAEDDRPVALVPSLFGRYREIDPRSKRNVRLTAERAKALKNEAWMFYRPLPAGDVQTSSILKFAFHGAGADIARLVVTGLVHGLTRFAPALALGFVANEIVAGAGAQSLYALVVALVGFGLLSALFHILQSTTMMRLQTRSTSRIEAAFWDHLMRLPSSILQRYPAGDLAMSGMSFQKMCDSLQGTVADSFLSIIFLLPIFGVIFLYDATLGTITLAFSLLSLLITVVLGLCQISPYSRMINASRRVTGRLFEIIRGITKLRVENAEASAFAIWARNYREQKRAEIELGALEEHSQAFSAALPFLAAGTLLFAVMTGTGQSVAVGDFLVIYALFLIFQSAVARLGESFGTIAATLPALEQIRPLLNTTPEIESAGEPIEFLGGDVLFDRISFRYDTDGPLILDDVTIHARAGEFIAIAGESGAGKSTIFRLALGMDRPSAGAVYYDGRDLRHLNLKQVRQNIGSVPQSVRLHPQDLWDNVVGHHESVESGEISAALSISGIEDEIKHMPMGMMTMVGTSSAVLSGGESQRIMIARSVIRNPRIILFDEATNWLDNESQAQVLENLSKLNTTRIVIAHRLTTLKKADRIYVLQAGKVVQCGSYMELMETDGLFKDLVKRQIA